MAGDWIKVEHATLEKPEVLAMADLLGVSINEMLGILFQFWVWLDRNSRHANVTLMSRKSLDHVTRCAGFAAAMEHVKWATWDDKAGSFTISNYDRHNGDSAKNRGLGRDRKAAERSRKSHANTVTREEKRREEIDTSLRSVSKPRQQKLDAPSAEHEGIAAERGLSCQTEFQKYRDWQASTGKRHKDENAGFRNWLRNAKQPIAGREPTLAEKRARNMDLITGKVRDERTIEGTAERVGGAVVLSLPNDLREQGGDDVGGCGPDRIASGMGRGSW